MLGRTLALAFLVLAGCRTGSAGSEAKSIDLVNTADAKANILTLDNSTNTVTDTICEVPDPANACACPAPKATYKLSTALYLKALPYDTGPWPQSQQGLANLTNALTAAKQQANSNPAAAQAAQQLAIFADNMQAVLQIQTQLGGGCLTKYNFDKDFALLLAPFAAQQTGGVTGNCQFTVLAFATGDYPHIDLSGEYTTNRYLSMGAYHLPLDQKNIGCFVPPPGILVATFALATNSECQLVPSDVNWSSLPQKFLAKTTDALHNNNAMYWFGPISAFGTYDPNTPVAMSGHYPYCYQFSNH